MVNNGSTHKEANKKAGILVLIFFVISGGLGLWEYIKILNADRIVFCIGAPDDEFECVDLTEPFLIQNKHFKPVIGALVVPVMAADTNVFVPIGVLNPSREITFENVEVWASVPREDPFVFDSSWNEIGTSSPELMAALRQWQYIIPTVLPQHREGMNRGFNFSFPISSRFAGTMLSLRGECKDVPATMVQMYVLFARCPNLPGRPKKPFVTKYGQPFDTNTDLLTPLDSTSDSPPKTNANASTNLPEK